MLFNVGETAVLTQPWGAFGSSTLFAQPASLTKNAQLQSVSFYVATAAGRLIFGVYTDNAGAPGTLIAQTPMFAAAAGWNTQAMPAPQPNLAPGTYWLAVFIEDPGLVDESTNTGTMVASIFAFQAMPSAFPGFQSQVAHLSLYATLFIADPVIDTDTASPSSAPAGTVRTITITAHDPNNPPQALTSASLVRSDGGTVTPVGGQPAGTFKWNTTI